MCAADADEVPLPRPERGPPLFPLPPPALLPCWIDALQPSPPPSRSSPFTQPEPNCSLPSALGGSDRASRVLRPCRLPAALLCSTSCLSCPSHWPPAISAGHDLLRVCRIALQHVTIAPKPLPLRRAPPIYPATAPPCLAGHTESTQRTTPALANKGFCLNSPLNSVPPRPPSV